MLDLHAVAHGIADQVVLDRAADERLVAVGSCPWDYRYSAEVGVCDMRRHHAHPVFVNRGLLQIVNDLHWCHGKHLCWAEPSIRILFAGSKLLFASSRARSRCESLS